ncbi:Imm8 family immunity protein [Pseudocolwellia sp. HL-MZ7]|uniref:Imm8 family immunity protein n=1 Tax=Pseudocolwellia sp. HL-MZ7 TaxID=3400627 RepID=UPI003CF28FF5
MIPIIISFDCADYDPIDSWIFPDLNRVEFWVNFTIGPNRKGGDNFLLHVVTTEIAQSNQSLANAVILDSYSWDAVLLKVNEILNQSSGENWNIISTKLSKRMAWEFEDYQPYNPV